MAGGVHCRLIDKESARGAAQATAAESALVVSDNRDCLLSGGKTLAKSL